MERQESVVAHKLAMAKSVVMMQREVEVEMEEEEAAKVEDASPAVGGVTAKGWCLIARSRAVVDPQVGELWLKPDEQRCRGRY